MKRSVGLLAASYYVAVFAYSLYGWYSYTGLFRLFAEWQMERFGAYDVKLTVLLPLLALGLVGLAMFRLLGRGRTAPTKPMVARVDASPRIVALLGLGLSVIAAGSAWYGYRNSGQGAPAEPVDLSAGRTPASSRAVLTAIARTDYMLAIEIKTSTRSSIDRYIPLTSSDWQPGQPLVYFLKTNQDVYIAPAGVQVDGSGMHDLSPKTPPFEMTTDPGLLVADDLPGPVAETYRKANVALADKIYVLEYGADDNEVFYAVALGSGIFAIGFLAAAGGSALRKA